MLRGRRYKIDARVAIARSVRYYYSCTQHIHTARSGSIKTRIITPPPALAPQQRDASTPDRAPVPRLHRGAAEGSLADHLQPREVVHEGRVGGGAHGDGVEGARASLG